MHAIKSGHFSIFPGMILIQTIKEDYFYTYTQSMSVDVVGDKY